MIGMVWLTKKLLSVVPAAMTGRIAAPTAGRPPSAERLPASLTLPERSGQAPGGSREAPCRPRNAADSAVPRGCAGGRGCPTARVDSVSYARRPFRRRRINARPSRATPRLARSGVCSCSAPATTQPQPPPPPEDPAPPSSPASPDATGPESSDVPASPVGPASRLDGGVPASSDPGVPASSEVGVPESELPASACDPLSAPASMTEIPASSLPRGKTPPSQPGMGGFGGPPCGPASMTG